VKNSEFISATRLSSLFFYFIRGDGSVLAWLSTFGSVTLSL